MHEHISAPGVVWTALAKRSGDSALGEQVMRESGVALRLPPQSKTFVRFMVEELLNESA